MRFSEHQGPEQSTGWAFIFEDTLKVDFLTYLSTSLIHYIHGAGGLSRLETSSHRLTTMMLIKEQETTYDA